jgi:electron transfer flavoprotein alpha subunit
MPDTLVLLEQRGGGLHPDGLGLLHHAVSIGYDVAGVVLGEDAASCSRSASGVRLVYAGDAPELADPLPQARAEALAELVRRTGADNVLLAASELATEVAGGLAAALEGGVVDSIVELARDGGELVATRLDSAAGDLVEVTWARQPRIALTCRGRFEPRGSSRQPHIEKFDCPVDPWAAAVRVAERRPVTRELRTLADATTVVAGGRGVGGPAGFRLCEELALELGGGVAATGAAVGLQWYPRSALVGQTGRTTAPALYVALGVSGALHHRLGMQDARTLIAVNRDPRAPIFEFADLAVVGDIHDVVPRLIELLRARRGADMKQEETGAWAT